MVMIIFCKPGCMVFPAKTRVARLRRDKYGQAIPVLHHPALIQHG